MTTTPTDSGPFADGVEADNLRTEIGKMPADFPNYGDWSIALPAGHWRALASPKPVSTGEVERERWETCNCSEPPYDDEVVYDRNLSPRCPRCNVALGGDPMTDSARADLAAEEDAVLTALTPNSAGGGELPADVRRLVIAARYVTDQGTDDDESRELLDAVEAFSSRVPYDDDPEVQRILGMSDEEIFAEVRGEGLDPETEAARIRQLVAPGVLTNHAGG